MYFIDNTRRITQESRKSFQVNTPLYNRHTSANLSRHIRGTTVRALITFSPKKAVSAECQLQLSNIHSTEPGGQHFLGRWNPCHGPYSTNT
jgi:hypothetical protein